MTKAAGPVSGAVTILLMAGATASAAPSIDDIHWPYVDSYCTFQRDGQAFEFDDLETWRFVFLTNYPDETHGPLDSAFMRINARLVELKADQPADPAEVVTYSAASDPALMITLRLGAGRAGYENTSYAGTLTVEKDGDATTIPVSGGCGV